MPAGKRKTEVIERLRNSIVELKLSGVPSSEIIAVFRDIVGDVFSSDVFVPTSIFATKKLGALEATIRYLKDHEGMNYQKIGTLLDRKPVIVGHSYRASVKKHPEPLEVVQSPIVIPVTILKDRSKGVQQLIVKYLHDIYKLRFKDIARILARDHKTVWTAYRAGGAA